MNRVLGCACLLTLALPGWAHVRIKTPSGADIVRTDYGNVQLLYHDSLLPGAVNGFGRAMITADSDPVAAIKEVAAAWSNVDGSAIRFATPAATSDDPSITDGRSTIVLKDTPTNRSVAGTALAVTMTRALIATGEVVDSDIVMNPWTNELFGAPFATTGNSNTIDFTAILMHEVGHLLGGNHSPLMGATMYYQGGTFDPRNLSEDDKSLARAVAPAAGLRAYGELRGTVLLPDGLPARGIAVIATDRTTGAAVCAVTSTTGTFSIPGVPAGNYVLFAEPLDGPTPLAALNLTATSVDGEDKVEAMIVGGGATPTIFTVGPGTSTTADFTMPPSAQETEAVDIRYFSRGRTNGTTDATTSSSPITASRGETLDLIIGGLGIVDQLGNATIELIGAGARIIPGSIRVAQARNTLQPTVRFTVEVTGAPIRSLVSVVYRTPTAMSTVPGAFVVAPAGQSLTLISNGLVNASSFRTGPLAPASWVSIYAGSLSDRLALAGTTLATILDGTTVQVTDGQGLRNSALLQFVSPGQINFLMPSGAAPGPGRITVTTAKGTGFLDFSIENVAPGIFAANANGQGPAASSYLNISSGSTASDFTFNPNGSPRLNTAVDISVGDTYLTFYGTGLRLHRDPVTATVGGVSVPVLAAVAQGQFLGLDQINIGPLPRSLAGRGEVSVLFNVDGKTTNPVTVTIK